MKSTKNVFILLTLVLTSLIVSSDGQPVCGNTIVTCSEDGDELDCEIRGQDTEAIQQTIYECSQGSYDYLEIEVRSGGRGVTLLLNVPSNIRTLKIDNPYVAPCFVETSLMNFDVTTIFFDKNEVFINHNDFFMYFPNLEYFYADVIGSNLMPFFSQNIHIVEIEVDNSLVVEESSRVIDQTIVGGLSKLEIFQWNLGGITKLMPNSFIGTYMLEKMSLSGNNIHELYDCTFNGLSKLTHISFSENNIDTVGEYTFIGLDALQIMSLRLNPSFPLSTLTLANTIKYMYLHHYNPALLNPEFFQQFPNLAYVSLYYISFNCTCETQWISIFQNEYNVNIGLDSYNFCSGNPNLQVDDPALYASCSNPSYQCFDHSLVCQGSNTWYRVDTENGCECTYPPERALYNNSNLVCSDLNECEDSSITCQGKCTNTLGSYKCDCSDGFANLNETFCEDVNECDLDNGGCLQICNNTDGSFNCSCFEGYVLTGSKDCAESVSINETEVNNGNCSQVQTCNNTVSLINGNCSQVQICNNTVSSLNCSCFEEFVISTLNNSTCELIDGALTNPQILNLSQTELILVALAVIIFILIIGLFLIILAISCCLYVKRSSSVEKNYQRKNKEKEKLENKVEVRDRHLVISQYEDLKVDPKTGTDTFAPEMGTSLPRVVIV
ncbi:Deleted in malignant brain tumors 1 protein-like [Oopsacas minuta]|uniref:Deleted in malignant brain tumors 1 protein-like n=1 Tax=Oopsacas minuta TaxID=111878 RepID=A0AAV7K8X9_9METZ|nr:Deleted in malignant brain tumors 1 protein-like [Oopsacas minuta]